MAGETTNSVQITALEANSKLDAQVLHGVMRVAKATEAVATTEAELADIVLKVRIPSNASIASIMLFNDDLDSHSTPTLAADVGLYYGSDPDVSLALNKKKGDVADADAYASAITTLQAANTTGVEVMFEARDINKVANKVWQDAGLSADPQCFFDIGLTVTTAAATAAAGDVSVVVTYVVN